MWHSMWQINVTLTYSMPDMRSKNVKIRGIHVNPRANHIFFETFFFKFQKIKCALKFFWKIFFLLALQLFLIRKIFKIFCLWNRKIPFYTRKTSLDRKTKCTNRFSGKKIRRNMFWVYWKIFLAKLEDIHQSCSKYKMR